MSQSFEPFVQQLRHDLQQPLPGRPAQFVMAPRPRPGADGQDNPGVDARQSGVLVLLYPHAGEVHLPLILRPNYGGVHSGQVGFPGGGYEPQDTDLVATALREAQEEIGVPPGEVQLLGRLSPLYIPPSNYSVQPTLGWMDHRPDFHIDPHEVALLIEAPLVEFLHPGNRRAEVWQLRDRSAEVPFFQVRDQIIWGATAMILSELLALPAVQRLQGSPQPK
jgi:8-oxo-dGTP pyrophosphatase MutT (NUDIX family)